MSDAPISMRSLYLILNMLWILSPGWVWAEATDRPSFREPPVAMKSLRADTTVELWASRNEPCDDPETNYCLQYNGVVPGETIYMDPGGTQSINLSNNLTMLSVEELEGFSPRIFGNNDTDEVKDFIASHSAITNLHTHGLHVSPQERADNVMLVINPARAIFIPSSCRWIMLPGPIGITPTCMDPRPYRSKVAWPER